MDDGSNLTRRQAIAVGAALALSPAVGQAQGTAGSAPIVNTVAGPVRGAMVDDVFVFKGVRYGASTEGRRFRPPRPPQPWREVRDALDYAAQSLQLPLMLGGMTLLSDFILERPQSEDCLFLNVWTGGLNDAKPRPVMVWLHGGAFIAGSGASQVYDGVHLVHRGDVVVVTINHRLNLFGYLYLGDFGGPAFADSGNVGMLDLVLALQWVRDNIAKFGGDPNNVTIFGESGGGYKVSTLMAMPAAKGLFHKAVVQSGPLIVTHTKEAAAEYARKFMHGLNLRPDQVPELCALPTSALVANLQAGAATVGLGLGAVVDGRSLPNQPFDPAAPPASKDVPMLIGTNKDEAAITADASVFAMTPDALRARLAPILMGKDVDAVIAELRRIYPFARPSDLYLTVASWGMMRRNSVIQADRKAAQNGAPAYMYLLAWETPVDGGKWKAPHALDLPMVFDNVATSASMVGTGGQAQRVADAMSTAWIRFARTGDPGWPAYTPATRATMVFNSSSRVEYDPDGDERQLLQAPPTPSPAG